MSQHGDLVVSVQDVPKWGISAPLSRDRVSWHLEQKDLSPNFTGCTSPTSFPLFLHEDKSTVSILALMTHLTCTELTANAGTIIPFYGWRNWAWNRLSRVTLSKGTSSSWKLSSRAGSHSPWLCSPGFQHPSTGPTLHVQGKVVLVQSAPLQPRQFGPWGHSHCAWTELSWSQQTFARVETHSRSQSQKVCQALALTKLAALRAWVLGDWEMAFSMEKNALCPPHIPQLTLGFLFYFFFSFSASQRAAVQQKE